MMRSTIHSPVRMSHPTCDIPYQDAVSRSHRAPYPAAYSTSPHPHIPMTRYPLITSSRIPTAHISTFPHTRTPHLTLSLWLLAPLSICPQQIQLLSVLDRVNNNKDKLGVLLLPTGVPGFVPGFWLFSACFSGPSAACISALCQSVPCPLRRSPYSNCYVQLCCLSILSETFIQSSWIIRVFGPNCCSLNPTCSHCSLAMSNGY